MSANTRYLVNVPLGICRPLKEGEQRLGRSSLCELVIEDVTVSKVHALITVTSGDVFVTDRGSLNGVILDGKPVHHGQVALGGVIHFGGIALQLVDLVPLSSEKGSSDSTITMEQDVRENARYLTNAQHRVMELLLEGHSEKQIAKMLKITRNTVHNHVKVIYKSFSVTSRPELMHLFVDKRLALFPRAADESPSGLLRPV